MTFLPSDYFENGNNVPNSCEMQVSESLPHMHPRVSESLSHASHSLWEKDFRVKRERERERVCV